MFSRLYTLLAVLFGFGLTGAMAATDIAGVIVDVTEYKTSAITLAIAIILFVIGRRIVTKLAK